MNHLNLQIASLLALISLSTTEYHPKEQGVIYILNWLPFKYTFTVYERQPFIKKGCNYTNCFVTNNRKYFVNVTDFDAILFYATELFINPNASYHLPQNRSEKQIYVLFSDEPSASYPITSVYNNFFNMTWTYKLNSDAYFGYIAVRDIDGNLIGPKEHIQWRKNMSDTPRDVILKIENKTLAVAWFVSHCPVQSQREFYVQMLAKELKEYGQTIDIYGTCGNTNCSKREWTKCQLLVEKYYFYLAFENAICEDYVTEKLLTALNHYTVPIVFGGADYTRFMPNGIYLDATTSKPDEMAALINYYIADKTAYRDMFKWRNHYTFHSSRSKPDSDPYCSLCRALNEGKTKVYDDIVGWFNQPTEKLHIDFRSERNRSEV